MVWTITEWTLIAKMSNQITRRCAIYNDGRQSITKFLNCLPPATAVVRTALRRRRPRVGDRTASLGSRALKTLRPAMTPLSAVD